ncbi:MAG TPA: 5-deoxy-glucuronate isomerase [Pilimelia sp.]|nr:5-deoxy-glucuronate isomerase [Pilimelia sp.]
MADWYLPAGSTADGPWALAVTPERSGLAYASLRVLELPAGGTHTLATGGEELIVLPLAGGCEVASGDDNFILAGRPGVFDGVSDFCYLPRGARAVLSSDAGGRFALAGAPAGADLPARYQPAAAVPVELRGAASCSRQVNNLAAAGGFECDSLIVVEVLTPSGNWSSYPPHKHDEQRDDETALEEIYYFEVAGGGVGYQRVYASDPGRPIDVLAEVRTGDTVLVPYGWHGPSMAAPGYHLYYLNVMAGAGPERAWRFRDDPAHGWIRGTWCDLPLDPRLPLTGVTQ